MKILRTSLSVIALLAAALGVAAATGAIHWENALVDLITSGGALLGTFGVAPLALTTTERRVCAGLASFAAMAVTAHASGAIHGAPRIFNVVAVGAALLAVLGRWDEPARVVNVGAPAADAPPPVPPKAA